MKDDIKIEIISGVGKESKKPYRALKVVVGEWSKLFFVGQEVKVLGSNFELNYIEQYLEDNK